MNKLDRFKILINHLKSLGIIENQQDLGKKMGYNNSSAFSQVINGKAQEPKLFMQKLEELYPPLNVGWLETGEGSMLKSAVSQATHGDNSPNINGNGNSVENTSTALNKALDEISELRKMNAEQFDRLMTVIDRLTQNIK